MTPDFWTSLPGLITAAAGAIAAIGTFILSRRKSRHEELEQLYSEMKHDRDVIKRERDDYYDKWRDEVKKNIELEKGKVK